MCCNQTREKSAAARRAFTRSNANDAVLQLVGGGGGLMDGAAAHEKRGIGFKSFVAVV